MAVRGLRSRPGWRPRGKGLPKTGRRPHSRRERPSVVITWRSRQGQECSPPSRSRKPRGTFLQRWERTPTLLARGCFGAGCSCLERELPTPRFFGARVWEEADVNRARHRLKSNPWNPKPQMTLGALQTPADSADTPAVTLRAGKRLEPWCIMYFIIIYGRKRRWGENRAEFKQPDNSSI